MPGHAELACKLATGNELISGMQAARGNGVAELLVQLRGQRLPGSRVEEQVHPAGLPSTWYGQTMPSWTSTADHLLPNVMVCGSGEMPCSSGHTATNRRPAGGPHGPPLASRCGPPTNCFDPRGAGKQRERRRTSREHIQRMTNDHG